jgi:hypothetical protein
VSVGQELKQLGTAGLAPDSFSLYQATFSDPRTMAKAFELLASPD